MSAALWLGIGVAGGVGALARFLLDGAIAARIGRGFPWGTFAVNLSGSFLLGLLVGVAVSADAERLAATGAIASLTTFSTWMLESHRLGEDGRLALGLVNIGLSLVCGLAAVWLGRELGGLL